MVFCARYLDLFWNWLSYYNVVMKIIFIISSIAIVYTIRFGVPHKDTYNAEDDTFPYLYLIVPAAVLGVAINQVARVRVRGRGRRSGLGLGGRR